jgi:recombination protein RecR
MNLSSKYLEDAVNTLASLPGIGKKTALRLALHLLTQPEDKVGEFASSVTLMRKNIQFCKTCHNISDSDKCLICESNRRDKSIICVVEGIRDVMAIEDTSHFRGLYHVLDGIISPIEGIGPNDLNIASLLERAALDTTKEVIMALSPTIEGDTTIFYISKLLQKYNVKVTTIARGVAFGGELQYADEVTLGRSIASRIPYNK